MLRAMPLAGNNGSDQAAVTKETDEVEDGNELVLSNTVKHAPPSSSSGTLLPRPVASLVTLFAQSTSLSLRVGTYLGGFAIDSARATTLTGLELSRAVVEGILVRAGRDVSLRSAGEYGRLEAESLLERSLATLHSTITSASFFASASFHLSSVTLTSVAGFSQNLLSTLDAILGSSESSRAIAAIITLIRREFKNQDTVGPEEKVGVGDLLVGSIGFALLQRWGRRATERETIEKRNVEIIWDVVILDNGVRADVLGAQQAEYEVDDGDNPSLRPASFLSPGDIGEDGHFEAIKRDSSSVSTFGALVPHVELPADRQHELSDDEIRRYIVNQLPPGSRASIRTEAVTSRTITVDIFDQDIMDIEPPPGTAVVEESFHHSHDNEQGDTDNLARHLPKHTVVFKTASNQAQSAYVSRDDPRGSCPNKRPHSPQGPEANYGGHAKTEVEMSQPDTRTLDVTSKKPATDRSMHNMVSANEPETSSSTFGMGPFSKVTQKVKPNMEDRHRYKVPPLRIKSKAPSHSTYSSTQSPRGPTATGKENAPDRRAASGFNFKKPLSKVNTKGATSPLHSQRASLELPDQILPSVHAQRDSKGSKRAFGTSVSTSPNNNVPPQGSPSSGYYSVREKSVESFVAQTDAYSRSPVEQRPGSPTVARHHVRRTSALSRSKSDKEASLAANDGSRPGTATSSRRGSSKSIIPSIYSVTAPGSETSLVLAPRPVKSAYESESAIVDLKRQGQVPGLFPDGHLVKNIHRFCRFSSASYGSNFLRVMGISESPPNWKETEGDHREHSSFSNHTGLPASTILLSSFVDPAGGSNAAGETAQGFPLVHYLAVDHESKAIVLTLRGTWGFEDILTDMTCDYDDLNWLGKTWQVHKGMHASARRLLEGGGGRVMATIKAALEEFSDYGVIFCGHSLGGGVASLLATLIASPKDPEKPGPAFVTTSRSPTDTALLAAEPTLKSTQSEPFYLPPNRPIHVYAYGPPAVMSPALQRVTRGLITTIVNGSDVVPTLSLGVLHDFHAVSLAFKSDISGAKSQVRSRVWESITQSIVNKFYVNQPPILINAGDGVGEDSWAWATLQSLRNNLVAPKLLPPGEVFVVETMRVLQRDAFTMDETLSSADGYPRLGRPATRVQLKFIRDVESRFREISFGSGMLGDHSPARYEASLTVLARGVLEN